MMHLEKNKSSCELHPVGFGLCVSENELHVQFAELTEQTERLDIC